MNGYVKSRCLEAFGQRHCRFRGQINVKNRIAAIAIKMAMLPHIWTKPRRAPLQGNLPHDSAFHKGRQAIIYCRH